jgi:hypothetical protein
VDLVFFKYSGLVAILAGVDPWLKFGNINSQNTHNEYTIGTDSSLINIFNIFSSVTTSAVMQWNPVPVFGILSYSGQHRDYLVSMLLPTIRNLGGAITIPILRNNTVLIEEEKANSDSAT